VHKVTIFNPLTARKYMLLDMDALSDDESEEESEHFYGNLGVTLQISCFFCLKNCVNKYAFILHNMSSGGIAFINT